MSKKPKKGGLRLPKGFQKTWVKGARDETGSLIGGRGAYCWEDLDFMKVNNRARLPKVDPLPRKPLTGVPYATASVKSIREVERRVMRACRTIRAMPESDARFLGAKKSGMWQNVVQEFSDAYGASGVAVKFHPSPRDVSDCLIALGWCNILEKREFKLVWWRSFDISFGVIGANIGRSDETARRHYVDAMKKVWYASLSEAPAQ